MKRIKILISSINLVIAVFASILLISSCEETITGVNLPYKELLVIRAELSADSAIDKIQITRTLPPLENYSHEAAMITNAEGFIRHNGINYPLVHKGNGIYGVKDLVPVSGEKYELEVNWKGKRAFAETTVPHRVVPDTIVIDVFVDDDDYYYDDDVHYVNTIKVGFLPVDNAIYTSAEFMLLLNTGKYAKMYIEEIETNQNKKFDGKVYLPVYRYWSNDTNITIEIPKSKFSLESYDLPFYDYFLSRWGGESNEEIFSSSGTNVKWNIRGDGIGLFIGRAITIFELTKL